MSCKVELHQFEKSLCILGWDGQLDSSLILCLSGPRPQSRLSRPDQDAALVLN